MKQRFVLSGSGEPVEFSIRTELLPRREIAALALTAPDMEAALREAIAWARKYSEQQLTVRAFPAVRYAGELFLAKKLSSVDNDDAQPFVFIENNDRGSWVPPRALTIVK